MCWKQTGRVSVCVCWTGRLIVCDMGQEGMGGRGDGECGLSGQRGILFSVPLGAHLHVCPICVCVCLHTLTLSIFWIIWLCWLACICVSIYVHIACHIVMCRSSCPYSLECVCVCDIESCRGYSNKGMLVVGPRALVSLLLIIIINIWGVACAGRTDALFSQHSATHEMWQGTSPHHPPPSAV